MGESKKVPFLKSEVIKKLKQTLEMAMEKMKKYSSLYEPNELDVRGQYIVIFVDCLARRDMTDLRRLEWAKQD